MENLRNEVLKTAAVFAIVGAALVGALKLEDIKLQGEHRAYVACVNQGTKPIICSLRASFRGE
jgi:hypothetical protein